ncbi:MAG TPA: amino acid adenylation domain-containing protein [Saprospiraceae bacterium]|nr:amino acid adenylation domain-containing protein [Saprospiraceae bacterium]HMQ81655.1 amino acid adenylation domain-containing protein [Saprospiraceae bacterium]
MKEAHLLPLSQEQERLLAWLKLYPNTLSLSIPGAWELRGALQLPRFQQALQILALQHESLRTRFAKNAAGQYQRSILPSLEISLEVIDLQAMAAPTSALDEAMQQFQQHAFDVRSEAPLFAARLFQVAPERCIFMAVLHHLIADWWSLYLFFRDLMDAYARLQAGSGEEAALGTTRLYSDFVTREKQRFAPGILERERVFWKEKIAGRSFHLPFDLNDRVWQLGNAANSLSLHLPAQLTDQIKDYCLDLRIKPFTFFLGAIKLMLYALTEKADNLVLVPDHNRANRAEFETIGLFTSILPLINRFEQGEKLSHFLRALENELPTAKEHHLPIAELSPLLLENEPNPKKKRLQVVYSYMNAISSKDHIAGIDTQQIPTSRPATDFELFFLLLKHAKGQYFLILEYLKSLFPKAYIEQLITLFFDTIAWILADNSREVGQIFKLPSLPQKDDLVLAATFTTDPLDAFLDFWRFQLNWPYRITYAPYNQVFQEILNPQSAFQSNRRGANALLIRYEDWTGGELEQPKPDWVATSQHLERNISDLITALTRQMPAVPVVILSVQESPRWRDDPKWQALRQRCEEQLAHFAEAQPAVFFIPAGKIAAYYPVENYHYPEGLEQGHIPYTDEYYAALATTLVRQWHAIKRPPYKVIVLDADQTLWNGVVGEEGRAGIALDTAKIAFQNFILEQQQQGMLIALVSKNQEADVLDVLEHYPDMRLRREHLVAWKINWEAKSKNIRELAQALDLGLDSFIFIDDNPLECQEVALNCPGVLVLEMPASEAAVLRLLRHIWAFDRGKATAEDLKKTLQYRENFERNAFQQAHTSLDAFIEGLELVLDIHPLFETEVARAAQLTEKTNQFNFSTIRRSSSEIQALLQSPAHRLWSVQLKDRFGDYGFVGLMIVEMGEHNWRLDSFLLSCRALGRKVEHQMMQVVLEAAKTNHASELNIALTPTPRNEPARKFAAEHFSHYREAGSELLRYTVPTDATSLLATANEPPIPGDESEAPVSTSTLVKNQYPELFRGIYQNYHTASLIHAAANTEIGHLPKLKSRTSAYLAPCNELERQLKEIWESVLRQENIGVNDHFFELGGDSIKAIQMLALLKARGFSVEISALFEEPTIASLAAKAIALDAAFESATAPSTRQMASSKFHLEQADHYLPKGVRKKTRQRYPDAELAMPLSPMQEGIYYHWLSDKTSRTYFEQFSFRLKTSIDIDLIHSCFEALLERHQTLRTNFYEDAEQGLCQIVRAAGRLDFTQVDLRQEELEAQEKAIAQYRESALEKGFDLNGDPLIRLGVLDCGQNGLELVWSFHHSIMDGWSLGILCADLFNVYQAKAHPQHHIPLPLPGQYSDYIQWLQALPQEEAYVFWANYLDGFSGITPLPGNTYPGAKAMLAIDDHLSLAADLVEQLQSQCANLGITFNSLMQTAWGLLLSKYTHAQDVVFGTVVSGRFIDLPLVESTLGLFINTVPIRVQYAAETSVAHLAQSTQKKWQAGMAYHHIQLAEIQRRVNQGNPLFNHILVFENFPIDEAIQSQVDLDAITIFGQNSYDLSVIFNPHGGSFEVIFKYNRHKYLASQIKRLQSHFLEVLRHLAQYNLQELKAEALRILLPEERQMLPSLLNRASVPYPERETLVSLFEKQVDRTPDRVALVLGETAMSYRTLNAQANRLAHYLRTEKGVQSHDLVGILLYRGPEMIVAIIGILKAGAAYVPIDPAYPEERIQFMLRDSNCKALITQEAFDAFQAEVYAAENPLLSHQPENLAYVIYTSGTSGQPKGSLIEHRQVVRLFFTEETLFDFTETDVWTLFHSYCFDFSVWEIFGALLYGGKLVIVPEGVQQDPHAFLELLHTQKVSVLNQTPSAFYNLSQAMAQREYLPLSLRYIVFGGEALASDKLRNWKSRYPDTRLINMYGITETTVHVTHKAMEWTDIEANISNIGKPIPTLSCYVLDQEQQPVPIGIEGELYVGGKGVCRAYLNRPALNAQRFLPNPFEPGDRLYRSGDLVRILESGELEYRGRIDHQVKIRGYRIELGEIDRAIQSQEGVETSVVVAKSIQEGSLDLVAYLIGQKTLDIQSLRHHLLARLPQYMMPSYFVQLDALPLTTNGKIDQKALPNPANGMMTQQRVLLEPSDNTERELLALWKKVLQLDVISTQDSFFEIGGHSLSAVRLLYLIQNTFSIDLKLSDIFSHPSIEQLAVLIRQKERSASTRIEALPEQADYALSSIQSSIWIMEQLAADSIAYNMNAAILLEGNLQLDALQKAVDGLIQRHEVLRTVFINKNGKPRQTIRPYLTLPLEIVELPDLSEQDSSIKELADAHARQAFDLAQGPLIKIQLLRLQEAKHVLLINLHHIIADGWSVGVLAKALSSFYNAALSQKSSPLPPLRIQYKDYAAWQQGQLLSEAASKPVRAYWLDKLRLPLSQIDLPYDQARPSQKTAKGGLVQCPIPAALLLALQQLAQHNQCTLYMVLVALFKTLLYRYSGQEDIIIGTPLAGRDHPDLENQIGMYVNTVPLRDHIQGTDTFRQVLMKVRQTVTEAYDYGHYPFSQMVIDLGLSRDLSRSPLFDVMLVLQNNEVPEMALMGLRATAMPLHSVFSKFDVVFNFLPQGEAMELHIEYNSDLFHASRVSRWGSHFIEMAQNVIQQPDAAIIHYNIVAPIERNRLLFEFNDTKVALPIAQTVVHLFEQQVAANPDHPAVLFRDQPLTYNQLNALSNQIAHYLRDQHQVGPEVPVGLLLNRSIWRMAAIWGVLKAGGAYVPIDPNYPAARVAYMIKDSGLKVILTTSAEAPRADLEGLAELVYLDSDVPADGSDQNPITTARPENLAYILYTSGSTGQPKGVLIEHRGLVNLGLSLIEKHGVTREDRVCQFAPYTFDVSVSEMLRSFLSGATMVMTDDESMATNEAFVGFLQGKAISILSIPPSFLSILGHHDFPKLKVLSTGGEAPQRETVRFYSSRLRYFNSYGTTENSVCACNYEVQPAAIESYAALPIGKPIANTAIYILNEANQLMPIGMVGEIGISSPGLARGYQNNEAETARKFIPHPFKAGERLYKTGDLGKWLESGLIEFVGRKDHQVKIRGQRIELKEIEQCLQTVDGILTCKILVHFDMADEKSIAAYFTANRQLSAEELKKQMAQYLPSYMVPAHFVQLPSLPLTANGKVDEKALPAPNGLHSERLSKYQAPGSTLETQLQSIWSELLETNPIGVQDNFFDLGGHSLKAMELVARIRSVIHPELPLKALFTNPTIAQLARHIETLNQQPITRHFDRVSTVINGNSMASARQFTEQPLLSLIATGELEGVDSVAVGYVSDALPGLWGIPAEALLQNYMNHLPLLTEINVTAWGRIGTVILPIFHSQLYEEKQKLEQQLLQALHLSKTLGARSVALTGLLPSATRYGLQLQPHLETHPLFPSITTGHATTCASVLLNIQKILGIAGRAIENEQVGFIGLGSIGTNTLRLMLQVLPHPQRLLLCDLYSVSNELANLEQELREVFQFRGEITLVKTAGGQLPTTIYEATLLVGATNSPEVVQIDRLNPGTIIVDDSGPHCFNLAAGIKRLEEKQDILFTEGGALKLPQPMHQTLYLPTALQTRLNKDNLPIRSDAYTMMGCMLSGLLSSQFEEAKPTLGSFGVTISEKQYQLLLYLGIEGADLHGDRYQLPFPFVESFALKHGNGYKVAH